MIHLITSRDNHICYLSILINNLTNPAEIRYWFQIHSLVNSINPEELLPYETNTNKFLFNYYTNDNISDCIKDIASNIINRHAEMKNRPEDKQEEEIIISACQKHINSKVVGYLEAYTITHDLTVESIYKLMKTPSEEDIINTTKQILGVNDIDLDDLLSFSYALYKVLDRGR
jgi:hypothetical protein